ncbi:MAG TPA: SMP-30/gluconolactonase/LRE family protein [Kofleriaceae bacterium]|nr:SMP-30/gluconolactonase/LRE family protein [Kofleriaceae bacterium]
MTRTKASRGVQGIAAIAAIGVLAAAGAAGCTGSQWPASPVVVSEVARFDGARGQMSEGVAVREGTAYLGYVASGEVVAVDLESGAVTPYASLPQPVAGKGFVAGLAVHGDDLYAALVSFVPEVQAGIYRMTGAGGPAQLFAKHDEMAFPNGMAFDDAGQMYVTDSAAGAIFRVSTTGEVTRWLADPLLTGGKDSCGAGNGVGVPFDIGANGIVIDGETMFVTNTDRAQVVRIQIQKDGGAGAPRLLVPPSCDELSGADGLALAPDGDLIVAVNHLNKLMRVDREGHVTQLASGGPLDFPASLVFAGDALYISNFAFLDAKRPALLRIP